MKKMLRNQEKLDTKRDEASGPASTYFEIVQQLARQLVFYSRNQVLPYLW